MYLEFQFSSLTELFQMAGHGPYVWACYAIGLMCLASIVIGPLRARRSLLNELQRVARIEAHEKEKTSK